MILVLSLIPLGNVELNQHDKFNHFIAFFVFTILGFFAYRFGYFFLFIIGLTVGVLIEVFQSFTKYRSAELADLLADGGGVLIGIFMIFLFNRVFFKVNKNFALYNINLNKVEEE